MTTFRENPPEIKLIGYTSNPLGIMYEVWNRSRDIPLVPNIEHEAESYLARRKAELEVFHKLIYEFTQIPEFIQFSWWIDGMPRAFFDQMTRYRNTGFFARSQRIRDQRGFAWRGEYLTTPEIARNQAADTIYRETMETIDKTYASLIALGIPAEDARGVLPLHMRTGFGWTFSLRDLAQGITRARTCHLLQQEYWAYVLVSMKQQLSDFVDPELAFLFQPPCERNGTCLSKIEAEQRSDAVLGRREDGVTRYDLHPCRIYTDNFETSYAKKAINSLVEEGKTRWAKSMEETIK
jgi:thymidylate synthase ThyX